VAKKIQVLPPHPVTKKRTWRCVACREVGTQFFDTVGAAGHDGHLHWKENHASKQTVSAGK